MYFYRVLHPIFALSFDFDDTLYNNRPVIALAEQKSLLFLRKYHPMLRNIQKIDCDRFRFLLYQQEPDICHDVTYWRWKSLRLMLCHAGLNKYEASFGADGAMDIIIRWRNKIHVPIIVHNILLELSSRLPLVAITNGNVNPVFCGLSEYFTYIFRSGQHGRSKPYTDMYYLAAKRLGLSCKNILHVGDNLEEDVKGAIFSGMQSCWTNEYISNHDISITMYVNDEKCVPHLKISSLLSLAYLLL